MKSNDLISRNAALALVVKAIHGTDSEEIKYYLFHGLRKQLWALPSAQPERKKGKWIDEGDPLTLRCSKCDYRVARYNNTNYCPHCGAEMKGEIE